MYYQPAHYIRPMPKDMHPPPPIKYQAPPPSSHDPMVDNAQAAMDLPEMVNQVRSIFLTNKKGPSKKQKMMRCPQYACWESFQRFEELQAHMATHEVLKAKGPRALPDGRFLVSEQMLKTVLE